MKIVVLSYCGPCWQRFRIKEQGHNLQEQTRGMRGRDPGAELNCDLEMAAPFKKARQAFLVIVLRMVSGCATTEVASVLRLGGRRGAHGVMGVDSFSCGR